MASIERKRADIEKQIEQVSKETAALGDLATIIREMTKRIVPRSRATTEKH